MAFSKVTLNGETLMDVTPTTVTPNNLLKNETALGANGETVVGTVDMNELKRMILASYATDSVSDMVIANYSDGADGIPIKSIKVNVQSYDGVTNTNIVLCSLLGIPVTSNGNYTDDDGQQWICDTIDREESTYTKRVEVFTLDGGAYTPTTVETVGSYTRFWYQVSTTSIKPTVGTMCSHLLYDPSGYSQARAGFGIDSNYPRNIWAKMPTSVVGSTAASIRAWMQENPMTLLAALATPVTTELTEEQLSSIDLIAENGLKKYTVDWSSSAGSITSGVVDVISGELETGSNVYTITPIEPNSFYGINYIFAYCGSITAVYRADPTLYIDKRIAESMPPSAVGVSF